MSREIALIESELKEIELQERQFEILQRKGKMLAQSKMVPDSLKNNIADCTIVTEMAQRLCLDPFLVARQIYFVHGKPGFESKFLIGQLNRSGILTGRLKFRSTGKPGTDSAGCIAWGVEAKTGEKIEGPEITLKMAKDEGWYSRNGSKWKTLPDLMLNYRAASFFISTFCPEILSGFNSVEELQDYPVRDVDAEVIREGKHFDYETGEVLDPDQEEKQNQFENMQSPAYMGLCEKLDAVKEPKEIEQLKTLPIYNRCTAEERKRINAQMAEKHKSFEFQQSQQTGA